MKYFMHRDDLGEPSADNGYKLVHTEEHPMEGHDKYCTLYVYEHLESGTLCGFKMFWDDENGSEPSGVVMGSWEGDTVELVPVYRKEVVTYCWMEVEQG